MNERRRMLMGKADGGKIPEGAVDMGLPSGLLWASGNIVQDGNGGYKVGLPTDYGAYFSWGNIEPHFSTNGARFDDNYNFGSSNSGSPYKDTPGASIPYTSQHKNADYAPDSGHDAARELLGNEWRMPTANEFQELIDNCNKWEGTKDGIMGRFFRSPTTENTLFFPHTGYGYQNQVSSRNSYGYYMSSSLAGINYQYYAFGSDGSMRVREAEAYLGFSARAVYKP